MNDEKRSVFTDWYYDTIMEGYAALMADDREIRCSMSKIGTCLSHVQSMRDGYFYLLSNELNYLNGYTRGVTHFEPGNGTYRKLYKLLEQVYTELITALCQGEDDE